MGGVPGIASTGGTPGVPGIISYVTQTNSPPTLRTNSSPGHSRMTPLGIEQVNAFGPFLTPGVPDAVNPSPHLPGRN